jgi:hypothetical protein
MVKTRNVSQYPGTPPDEGEDRTILTEQPLYSAQAIAEVLAGDAESRIQPVTHRARQEMQGLGWDCSDVGEVIREILEAGSYLGSEWCALSANGTMAACDAYRHWRRERVPAGMEMTFEYYLKWAIGQSGNLLLLVSCHLSRG